MPERLADVDIAQSRNQPLVQQCRFERGRAAPETQGNRRCGHFVSDWVDSQPRKVPVAPQFIRACQIHEPETARVIVNNREWTVIAEHTENDMIVGPRRLTRMVEAAGLQVPVCPIYPERTRHAQMHDNRGFVVQFCNQILPPAGNRKQPGALDTVGKSQGKRKTQVRPRKLESHDGSAFNDRGQTPSDCFDFRQFGHDRFPRQLVHLQAAAKFNTDVCRQGNEFIQLRRPGEGSMSKETHSRNQAAARARHVEEMSRSYGFEEVDAAAKQPRVNAVFDRVAPRYDLMNDLMSAGLHRLWKDALVARLSPPRGTRAGWRAIDVAGGTGDIALRLVEASRGSAAVTVVDINTAMLDVGRERARRSPHGDLINFVEGNAEQLPFDRGSFDAYTIAFGIRNVPEIDAALREAMRVLRFGGQFLCLEFSEVAVPGLDRLYEQWSVHAIPRIGRIVAGDEEPYRYLVESIRKFPGQERFCAIIRDAGFARVGYRNLSGGIAALYWGWKL